MSQRLGIVLAIFVSFGLYVIQAQAADETVRALLTPETQATLSSQIEARIMRMDLRTGDRFKKGQELLRFHCGVEFAEVAKAKAELKAAETTFQSNQKLGRLGSGSALELALSEARVDEAKAELTRVQSRASYCRIRAPFSGRVAQLHVEQHESVKVGQKLFDLLKDSKLLVELFAPSNWLSWLKPGTQFQLQIDETQKTYQAKVARLGAQVDPVSRSIAIEAEIVGKHPELLAGMSGTARFSLP